MDEIFCGVTRRRFLVSTSTLLAGTLAIPGLFANEDERFVKEAMFYEKLPGGGVNCVLCPKECIVGKGGRGYCEVRENRGGKYYTLVHSRPCTQHIDPIEKKPLYHYKPGTLAYSLATVGCNLDCKYCQNWSISQLRPEKQKGAVYVSPEMIVREAKKTNCSSIAYTYSEPTIFYEYMYEIAQMGKEKGVPGVMISNGYILPEPMKKLCKVLDAVKIDLKGFTEKFYKGICAGTLRPVLDTLELLAESGIWYEIVVLVIPTLNDAKEDMTKMCKWIHDELGPNVPVHFSRFHPTYKLRNIPPTPIKALERCYKTARDAGLNYVYLGNVVRHKTESTYCHSCGKTVVERVGFTIRSMNVKGGKCPSCDTSIPGVWGKET